MTLADHSRCPTIRRCACFPATLTREAPGNYTGPMRAKIVRIGNSQGVRIPKPLLLRSGLSGEVEIDAQDDQIVIRAARRPREDWDAAFVRMSESGDDVLLDGDTRALPRTVLMLESCEVGTDIEHVTSP